MPFTCPRCRESVDDRYYGPCTTCRADLRAQHVRAARQVEREAYQPAMNVTPNAVAQKDD